MLTAADTPAVVRAWARGEHGAGRALWSRLAEAGRVRAGGPGGVRGGRAPARRTGRRLRRVGAARGAGSAGGDGDGGGPAGRLEDPGPAKRLLPALASGETHGHPGAVDGGRTRWTGTRRRHRLLVVDPASELRLAPGHGPVRALPRPGPPPRPAAARRRTPRHRPAVTAAAARPRPGPVSPPPRRPSASASRCSTGRSRTSGSAPSSACPIGSFQAVSTGWPTRRSPWSSRVRWSSGRRSPWTRPDVAAAKVDGLRGGVHDRPHRAPAARRDRLHGGVRPVAVADQGPRAADRLGQPGRVPAHGPQWWSPPVISRYSSAVDDRPDLVRQVLVVLGEREQLRPTRAARADGRVAGPVEEVVLASVARDPRSGEQVDADGQHDQRDGKR